MRTGTSCYFIGLLISGLFLILQTFLPLRTAVQIGADEGFEVAKATLCLHGSKLYSDVWNDQPPLHTWLITRVVRLQLTNHSKQGEFALNSSPPAINEGHRTLSILGPRLVTTTFTLLLLVGVFTLGVRVSGLPVGAITCALLIASPGFMELSASCMLEIPALSLAVAGLCILITPFNKWHFTEVLSGIFFGLAALTKLVPIYLLPLAALILWLRQRKADTFLLSSRSVNSGSEQSASFSSWNGKKCNVMWTTVCLPALWQLLRSLLAPLFIVGASFVVSFVLVDYVIERGAYLVNFQQSWSSHFGGVQSFEYGSPKEHAFDWNILLKNWDVTIPAVFGIYILAGRLRQNLMAIFPLAWLALSLIVFTNHKPWWSYYYIHIAIPLCWCAAVGIEFIFVSVAGLARKHSLAKDKRGKKVCSKAWCAAVVAEVALLALCVVGWMTTRVYLQITSIRNSPQLYSALVLKEIERLKPFTRWIYADQLVYSYHANIPMPPTLAVVPLKRLWAGDMTRARIAAEISRYKPEIILLNNNTREVPFQTMLENDYRLVYQDERQQLYAERETIKRADAAEQARGNRQ